MHRHLFEVKYVVIHCSILQDKLVQGSSHGHQSSSSRILLQADICIITAQNINH